MTQAKLVLEKDVEKKVRDWAQKNGLLSIKLSSQHSRGQPDRMFLNTKGQVMFIEFKKPGGQPTKLQEMWLETLEERGFVVMLCDDPDAGILALREKLL